MKASVIISTYNKPEYLFKVLEGLIYQSENDFEIIIADDGSTQKTCDLIKNISSNFKYGIKHVWQKDKGFRKSKILNKAILECKSDYIIFLDGDCIPFPRFIERHIKYSKKNRCLCSNYLKLSINATNHILTGDLTYEDIFCYGGKNITSLIINKSMKIKILLPFFIKNILDKIRKTEKKFVGCNASCWKKDAVKINGFDERFAYWAEDTEFGFRLQNNGVKLISRKYTINCLHLHHDRPYSDKDIMVKNMGMALKVKNEKIKYTKYGIQYF